MYPTKYTWRAPAVSMRQRVDRLQSELAKLPQYEPDTRHHFHGGMYCREVWRDAGVLVVGKVHKREHMYLIASGTVLISSDDEDPVEVTGPHLIMSRPGCKRAVLSVTPSLCMTFHRADSTTVEDAEAELVEDDPNSMYDAGNLVRPICLTRQKQNEVLQ